MYFARVCMFSLSTAWILETEDLPSSLTLATFFGELSRRLSVGISFIGGRVKGRFVTRLGRAISSDFVFSPMLELRNSWLVSSLVAEAMRYEI